MCDATVAWREDLGELVEELSQAGVAVEDVGVRKDLFRGFVADAESRTDTMVDEVLGLLGPDEGTATQRLAVGGDELAEDWAYAREMVEDFPDREDAEPFVSRGTQLTNEVERTGARWKTALNEAAVLASPELRKALVDEPSCTVIPRTADTAQE
ncbi:MAG: hypothetical protein H0W25_02590 [Acidimicrobiia bacterium]|nr:hypothetical protein [Acidimicrobiia bacterium]